MVLFVIFLSLESNLARDSGETQRLLPQLGKIGIPFGELIGIPEKGDRRLFEPDALAFIQGLLQAA
jgi:hypothetical protein